MDRELTGVCECCQKEADDTAIFHGWNTPPEGVELCGECWRIAVEEE